MANKAGHLRFSSVPQAKLGTVADALAGPRWTATSANEWLTKMIKARLL